MTATLYGLGVGPGDPELITLKALRIIERATVLAYPAPEHGDSLARSIVAPHLPGGLTEVAIRMPMVAARFPAEEVYDRASIELGAHLDAGRDVAVLCEGDPFLYGSFMYLFARMAERYQVEVVPGVSSLTACAAVARTALVSRNDVLGVIPATLPAATLAERIAPLDAAAIVKVGRHLGKVKAVLTSLGLMDRARFVAHATMTNERCERLADCTDDAAPYFSMVLVHRRGDAWR